MTVYRRWSDVPGNLATKTQLKADGLKPAPDQQPVATFSGYRGSYGLYERATAVAIRRLSPEVAERARASLEKARAALACVDCGLRGRLDKNGRCSDCRHHHQINRMSLKARERLSTLAVSGDWLVVDTETTGLDQAAEIIQIGIVDAAGQVLVNQIVRPGQPIPAEATAVHGINDMTVADAPTWSDVYQDIAGLLNGRLLLAYNADFDQRMIRQTCRKHGTAVPAWVEWDCVMELTAAYIGEWSNHWRDFRWHKLSEVYSLFDLRPHLHELPPIHDAAGDAWLTWKIVQFFREEETR